MSGKNLNLPKDRECIVYALEDEAKLKETEPKQPVTAVMAGDAKVVAMQAVPLDFHPGRMTADEWLENYSMVAACNEWKTDEQKLRNAPLRMKGSALRWYHNTYPAGSQPSTWDAFETAFKAVWGPSKPEMIFTEKAQTRKQLPNEDSRSYVVDKVFLMKKAGMKTDEASGVRMIIHGLKKPLRRKLAKKSITTVDKLVDEVKSIEEHDELYQSSEDETEVMMMKNSQPPSNGNETQQLRGDAPWTDNRRPFRREFRPRGPRKCWICGDVTHMKRDCPKRDDQVQGNENPKRSQ